MDFLQKNALYIKLQNAAALKADRALLKKKAPESKVLTTKFFGEDREANEILNALLDVATEEEILKNRGKQKLPQGKPQGITSGSEAKLPEPGESDDKDTGKEFDGEDNKEPSGTDQEGQTINTASDEDAPAADEEKKNQQDQPAQEQEQQQAPPAPEE